MNKLPDDLYDIVKSYLDQHKYDGLCHSDTECGCEKEELFCGLDCPNSDCQPAFYIECKNCKINNDCQYKHDYDADHCLNPSDNRIKHE